MKAILLALLLTLLLTLSAGGAAASGVTIALWPEGVPGARAGVAAQRKESGRIYSVSEPRITVVAPAPDRANGSAVIICPGGGYYYTAVDREGHQYANWLSTLGVTSFILNYRMSEFGHPAPLQDVLRAIRLVRSRAAEFGVDPQRIGVMGSSAGGHLAASAATLFDHAAGRTGAALDAVSARPDFALLMYPVISMDPAVTHAGSRKALLGAAPSAQLVQLMSLELQVGPATPPTVLVHTQDDSVVPVENSLLFYRALTRARVPAEMYLFETGAHGMAMRPRLGTASEWPRRIEDWLRNRKLLDPVPK